MGGSHAGTAGRYHGLAPPGTTTWHHRLESPPGITGWRHGLTTGRPGLRPAPCLAGGAAMGPRPLPDGQKKRPHCGRSVQQQGAFGGLYFVKRRARPRG